jgi:hypothetical protein
MKKDSRTRAIVWVSVIVFAIFVFTISPGAIQTRNMRLAKEQTNNVQSILQKDPAYENIRFRRSTALLGKQILVTGSVKTEQDLLNLKLIIDRNISHKFVINFAISVEENRQQQDSNSNHPAETVQQEKICGKAK